MSETHDISISIPSLVSVTLRGHNRELDTTVLPEKTLVWLLQKGIQRGANDPLGALFKKNEKPDPAKIDEYWTELVTRWDNGDVQKTRSGGLGRTSDPVLREMKRLANAEIDANIAKLLAAHNVPRKEFDESLRAQYVKKRLADHEDRLREKALANLAELKESAGSDIELIDFGPAEDAEDVEDSDNESEDEEEEEFDPS